MSLPAPPSLLLTGKVALVTGASSGIGRAAALDFAQAGARVLLADLDVAGGTDAVRAIEELGGQARFVQTDVTRERDVVAMVQVAVDAYGGLDCALNNAGIEGPLGPLADLEEADWDRVLNVNLKAVWLCLKHEIRHMAGRGGGAIVNTASIYGFVGSARTPAYAASKHGVVGLTKSAAHGYAAVGIRVNAVCPGYVQTAMIDRVFAQRPGAEEWAVGRQPVGRLGQPEEIAATVVWLCSDGASFITGAAIPVDGGFMA